MTCCYSPYGSVILLNGFSWCRVSAICHHISCDLVPLVVGLGGVDVKSFLDYWAADEINGNLGTHLLCFAPSSLDDDLDVPWV